MKKGKNNLSSSRNKKEKQIEVRGSSFSGSIPPPQILADYELISSGFADRIITMAESEAKHRHKMEERALKGQIWEIKLGQFLGFFIGIFTIAAGSYCALQGAQIPGSIIGTSGVAGLVSVFILGRSKKEK